VKATQEFLQIPGCWFIIGL